MRIWQIAFFIFVAQLTINLGGGIPLGFITPAPVAHEMFSEDFLLNQTGQISGAVNKTGSGVSNAVGDFFQSVAFIVGGVGILAAMLFRAVTGISPFLITIFGENVLPESMLNLITILVLLLYIVGAVQLFLGRSLKGDD